MKRKCVKCGKFFYSLYCKYIYANICRKCWKTQNNKWENDKE